LLFPGLTQNEAIVIASRFAIGYGMPIGLVAKAEYRWVGASTRMDCGSGEWLIRFHYVGPLTPPDPKVTLCKDVGWVMCVLINDRTGEAELWQDYRDE